MEMKKGRKNSPPLTTFTLFTLLCVLTFLIINREYSNRQYLSLFLISFVYFSYFLANYLSSIARSLLPKKNKTLEKNLLGFAIWFLFSSIYFGFVYQFYPLFGFLAGISHLCDGHN
ncbi:hypothetical protein AABB24_019408 [Solanum stoloniferum]|uniref:Uncharacterized protein n=1 Tax=Solanum stoloniferum TaxID=62892 RepID=A0ABD2TG08_9SOLN